MENKVEQFDITAETLRVFCNENKAAVFSRTVREDLDDLSPADFVAVYPKRSERVADILRQIEYGLFA